MQDVVQLKAKVPQRLKRQAFSVMALHGLKFSPWVRAQLERLVAEHQILDLRAHQAAAGEDDGQK